MKIKSRLYEKPIGGSLIPDEDILIKNPNHIVKPWYENTWDQLNIWKTVRNLKPM